MSNYQRWSGAFTFKSKAKLKKFLKGIEDVWFEWDMELYRLANVAYAARHLGTTGKWKKLMKEKSLTGDNFVELMRHYDWDFYWKHRDDLKWLSDMSYDDLYKITDLLRQKQFGIQHKMYKPKKPKKRKLKGTFHLGDFEFGLFEKAISVYADNNRPTYWNNPVGRWINRNLQSYGGSDQTKSVSEYDEDEWGNSMY